MNNVRFNLKNATRESTLIVLIYRYASRKLVMSTGINVKTSHWNSKKQRIKSVTGKYEYPMFNNVLDNYEHALRTFEADYFSIHKTPPTVSEFKKGIQSIISGSSQESTDELNLADFIQNYIDKRSKDGTLAKGSIPSYVQLLTAFKHFTKGTKTEFKDLDIAFLTKFNVFMSERLSYSTNQINKIQRRLTTVVNYGKTKGFSMNPEFQDKSWKIKASSIRDKGIALSKSEIEKIEAVELSPQLDKVRDRFIIGLSTGQRYSDFGNLSKDNIIEKDGKKYFNIIQKKTKQEVLLPISAKVLSILEKYSGYPPTYSSQRFNLYIKEICRLAGLVEEVTIRSENPISKEIDQTTKPKYQLTSSHICRRTYASLAHNKGVPHKVIMMVTGHQDLRSLSLYLGITSDSIKQLNQLDNLI